MKGHRKGKFEIGEHTDIARGYCLSKNIDPHLGFFLSIIQKGILVMVS
jgi:hypothetical protein